MCTDSEGHPVACCIHGMATFPQWHRLYVAHFEQALVRHGLTDIGVPYWDWTQPLHELPSLVRVSGSVFRLGSGPVFRLANSPVFRLANSPVFRLGSSPVFRLGSSPVFRLANSSVFRLGSSPVFRLENGVLNKQWVTNLGPSRGTSFGVSSG